MASDSAHVHELASAVIALSGIAFGVLVGQYRAGGLQDGGADEVFGGDEFEAVGLTSGLVADGIGDVRIGVG